MSLQYPALTNENLEHRHEDWRLNGFYWRVWRSMDMKDMWGKSMARCICRSQDLNLGPCVRVRCPVCKPQGRQSRAGHRKMQAGKMKCGPGAKKENRNPQGTNTKQQRTKHNHEKGLIADTALVARTILSRVTGEPAFLCAVVWWTDKEQVRSLIQSGKGVKLCAMPQNRKRLIN